MDHDERVLVLFAAAQQAGVQASAMADALRRGVKAFANAPLDAPHFFGPVAADPPPGDQAPAHPRRPQPVVLTPEQAATLQRLSPTQRLTAYRTLQARAHTGDQP